MDQLRTAISWLKRHHFWVLSGVAALIALGCWWIASRKVSAEYATNQKTITTEFDALKNLRGAAFHPNQAINERQDAEVKKLTESVLKLWERLYDRQRETVLKWPDKLSKAFLDAVEKMQFGDEIGRELRDNYQNYIDLHFPELPKQIGARMMLATDAGGGVGADFGRSRMNYNSEMPGGPGTGLDAGLDDDDYICEWLDQDIIRNDLYFPQRPSALRIWKTQEDLWVYHTLLNVIAKTNQAAGATRKSNAAVKTIASLEVGQRAAFYSRTPGRLLKPPAVAATPGTGEGPMSAEGPMSPGANPEGPRGPQTERMMEGPVGRGGPGGDGVSLSPAQEQNFLLSFRYLDDKGQPIPVGGAAVPGAEAAPSPDPAAAVDPNAPAPPLDLSLFGTGYKRLPVRMVLQMDGRWLPQLISACANEPLRVEVQEVRVNPPEVAGMEAGGMGMGGGGFRGFTGERGPGGGGGAGGSLFPEFTGLQNFPQQPNVVNVVIQGTIYIFNKPNPNLLKSSTEQPVP